MFRWVLRALTGLVLIAVLVTAGTGFRVWYVARDDDRTRADAIVVLGAAQYNGTPSSVFRARLGHAKDLYDEGAAPLLVTTGGSRSGDAYTEADAGARWLREQGVPHSATLAVAEGVDTYGSLEAAADEMQDRGLESVVVVSDPWHSLRARTMARDLGLDAWTSPTHSGPVVQTRRTQLRYIVRETGALLYYRISAEPADRLGGTGLG
ncbi:YdcF family protein [Haloechinothrix sp. YIM 98757]|uniref:YdcF family protein n=1 Tax=Haloechinothrix aidingensis TaxID=2752311 RepID=A0A838AAG2_9PSEU|nr:YdcF family protein [Haloechinothrix aidingensis]MBA0126221.1 YdcF family protein [Haloechinothrix aidingensis]